MKVYGTTTSPYVRKVRVVAAEVGEPVERIDTATDAGQAQLRELSPIRKVPAAVIDGRTLYDSRVICDWLIGTRGYGGLVPPRDRWHAENVQNAIEAALDSMVQVFYLRRDGVAIDGTTFARRQLDRTDAIFAWLGTQLAPGGRSFGEGMGLAEVSLVCALDWMDFRGAYDTARAAPVESVRAAWRERPSLRDTPPHA